MRAGSTVPLFLGGLPAIFSHIEVLDGFRSVGEYLVIAAVYGNRYIRHKVYMNRLSMKIVNSLSTVINGFDFAIRGLYFRIVNNKFNLFKKRSMINYSTYMWKSPLDETAKEQA